MTPKPDKARYTNPPAGNKPVLLYDGQCPFCRARAAHMVRHGRDRFIVRSFHEDGILESFPGLTVAMCMEEMKLVDVTGRVTGGVEAVVRALGHSRPLIGKVLYLYYIPGVRWIADRVYNRFARNRHRFGAAGGGS